VTEELPTNTPRTLRLGQELDDRIFHTRQMNHVVGTHRSLACGQQRVVFQPCVKLSADAVAARIDLVNCIQYRLMELFRLRLIERQLDTSSGSPWSNSLLVSASQRWIGGNFDPRCQTANTCMAGGPSFDCLGACQESRVHACQVEGVLHVESGSELAAELLRAGCMWNSFAMVARSLRSSA
jgi:hypothetical protein